MVKIETYILHDNDFVKVTPDTDINIITNTSYIEGAIVIKVFGEEILGMKDWDLIDHLWAYFLDALEELLDGEQKAEFLFPDQPLSVELRTERKNRNILLLRIGGKTHAVDRGEFFSELLLAAEIFYAFIDQCIGASIWLRKIDTLRDKCREW